jgi:sugar phosphate isomerase/epimerase
MYGISTAWRSATVDDGHQLLDLMLESGLSSLEIDYRITPPMLKQMLPRLKSSEFQVLTVHNYVPHPDGIPKEEASGDVFLLSSPDNEERQRGVKYALRTLQLAADLEASLVVFHLGHVDMKDEQERLFAFYEKDQIDCEESHDWFAQKLEERKAKATLFFDAVLKSLNRLNEEAYRLGVLIGAENRYRYTQIPFREEFDVIFSEFRGGQIRYWHDVGHGEVLSRLRILDHEKDLLTRYKDHLAGAHIHDILELKDHRAPGTGDFPFEILKPYLNRHAIRILEVNRHATVQEVRDGVALLQEKGVFI